MKLTKERKRKIRNTLWNYFQPLHEHLGFEKSTTIYEITEYTVKKCKITFGNKSEEILFRQNISSMVFRLLMNPNSKYYIKGLLCEVISIRDGEVTKRLGHFFIAKNEEEIERVKQISSHSIRNRTKMMLFRTNESYELLTQLEYDSSQNQNKLIEQTKVEG